MEAELTAKTDQSWQNDNLVKRLLKPVLQPGIISFKLADDILSRARNMTVPVSPLLMKRGEAVTDSHGEHLQIVSAQWVQQNRERPLRNEADGASPALHPAVQLKKSASAPLSNRTFRDIELNLDESSLPTVQAVSQPDSSENNSEPAPSAELQMTESVSGPLPGQEKTTVAVGRENNPPRHKKPASVLSNHRTPGDIASKTGGEHLPIVQGVSQPVPFENISAPISAAGLQRKEIKEIASENATRGKTALSAGTGSSIQYRGKPFDVSADPQHEVVRSDSDESSSDKMQIAAPVHSETVRQPDNTKWKISRRGVPVPQRSPAGVQKKAAPAHWQVVSKKKSGNVSSSILSIINEKEVDRRVVPLAEEKGGGEMAFGDNMLFGKTAGTGLEKSDISAEPLLNTSITMPAIREKGDSYEGASTLIVKHSAPGPVLSRKGTGSFPSASFSVSKNAKSSVPETGIGLQVETSPVVCRTSEQIQRAPALIWRDNEAHTKPVSISPGHPVCPPRKTVSVSMNSTQKNRLSLSQQAGSFPESGSEGSSMDIGENTVAEQRTGAGSAGVDLSRIADQVSRLLYRRLVVERERRGV
ncbi:MAG: hypothetical protein KKA76_07915 [Proteobacteria bacterium]|nr:hypothetical protein [Pseudomonadota bacterium]